MNHHLKLSMDGLYRKSVEEFKQIQKIPIYIVLDNIRSMHNVGSVFRTADAFLIQSIFLCGFTPSPPHREIQKTALGACDSVHWQYFNSTELAIQFLQQKNIPFFAIEQTENSTFLNNFIWDKSPIAFIFGNEVEGVSQEIINVCKDVIEIPQHGTKHSLNISISTAIVLWHIMHTV
ncbi:MAG: RNA methyltransferase [Sediminibacterium sp.]|nr:RNA methyltransferase [Sediminibacterium sp.]